MPFDRREQALDTDQRMRVLAALLLAVGCLLIATVLAPSDSGDFWYFRERAGDWFTTSGFGVYVDHPALQTGPLTMLLVGAIAAVDHTGNTLVPIVSAVMCGLSLWAVGSLEAARRHHPLVLALGGLVLTAWWWTLAVFGHLDDASVLLLAVAALRCRERDRDGWAALMIGASLALKPWAVFLLPMTIRRDRGAAGVLRGPSISVAVAAVCWAPFVIAEPATLSAMKPTVMVAGDSVLRLLGVAEGGQTPAVLRLVQLLSAVAVAIWVCWRGRPELALLAGVAVRLALDPATWEYYTPGLVLGALVYDLTGSPSGPATSPAPRPAGAAHRWSRWRHAPLPWATLWTSAALATQAAFLPWEAPPVVRLAVCVAAIVVVARRVRFSTSAGVPMNGCVPREARVPMADAADASDTRHRGADLGDPVRT